MCKDCVDCMNCDGMMSYIYGAWVCTCGHKLKETHTTKECGPNKCATGLITDYDEQWTLPVLRTWLYDVGQLMCDSCDPFFHEMLAELSQIYDKDGDWCREVAKNSLQKLKEWIET